MLQSAAKHVVTAEAPEQSEINFFMTADEARNLTANVERAARRRPFARQARFGGLTQRQHDKLVKRLVASGC